MECFECGVSGNKVRLFDAVSSEGIVSLCGNCLKSSDFPVLKKPTTFQLIESEKTKSYKDSLIRPVKNEKKFEVGKKDVSLREIVDKNYEKKVSGSKNPRPDLVDNFHWILMRARRMKKITQAQLAKEILESEAAIKMAEQGILPEDDNRLVNKLESFLRIRIRKSDLIPQRRSEPARILKIDPEVAKDLTIADLKRIKEAREKEVSGEYRNFNEQIEIIDEQPEIEIEYEEDSSEKD